MLGACNVGTLAADSSIQCLGKRVVDHTNNRLLVDCKTQRDSNVRMTMKEIRRAINRINL